MTFAGENLNILFEKVKLFKHYFVSTYLFLLI